MNTINIDNIGVVSLSESEENEITGGFSWAELGAAVFGGAAMGGLTGAAYGAGGGTVLFPGIGTVTGFAMGAAGGALTGAFLTGLSYMLYDTVGTALEE
jgi:hypothetical protein